MSAAAGLLKELAGNRAWRVVRLLDDDATKQGGELFGVKVLGPVERVDKASPALHYLLDGDVGAGARNNVRYASQRSCAAS
jgi:hypothetical protein